MRRKLLPFILVSAVAAAPLAATSAGAQPAAASAAPAPLSQLVRQVDIPYQSFTLPNGLRVYVHEDHKAPVVAVSVWYHVGSKDEPRGKTGFAHLFEHLMFNGSENAPGDFFAPLQQVGATDFNGTTWFDRTNYFETVPTPALDLALFLESDRMGHLLGAVTQENLTNQIGVVQNEKRQGDNEPYGLVEYKQLEALFPEGHPYHHSTIGSMSDLTGASLEDVKNWFRSRYGPNNAVLVLAGDVTLAKAKQLVAKYFGDIPRGPEVRPAAADVPTLAQARSEVTHDRVANTRLYRMWAVPGLTNGDTVPLDIAASVLGGLSSSRLDNALVRGEKVAVGVSANVQPFERVSLFEVTADVKPGVDPALVARRLDSIIADFIRTGPSADEVRRVATREVASRLNGLESVGGFGGKAVTLAEGALYAGDPGFYKKQLAAYAAATPAEVKAAAQKWLSRPVYALTVAPGEREAYEEAKGGEGGSHHPAYYRPPVAGEKPLAPLPAAAAEQDGAGAAARPAGVDRSKFPPVGEVKNIDFPDIQRTRLANGIPVIYAQRTAVPLTRVTVSFDAGNAADPRSALGTQALMLSLLDEGTKSRNSIQIAEEEERLGASIAAGASMDRTNVGLSALTPNLAPSLNLLADVIRNPAFDPAEVERLRGQQLARIAQEMTEPQGLALRTLPGLLYGPQHPYGVPFTGTGDAKAVAAVGRSDLVAFHDAWLRPDTARIFVVSDRPLAELTPLLERAFGTWAAPATPKGTKNLNASTAAPQSKIYLIDRPQSPQSVIMGGMLLPYTGGQPIEPLIVSNDVLGGSFLSRLNMDLRETKGWSYGVNGRVNRLVGTVPYIVNAPVQSNQTGPALAALQADMREFLTQKGIGAEELERTINNRVRNLAGNFETSEDVLGGLQTIDLLGFPDNYYETLAGRYRGMTAVQLDEAARKVLDPAKFVWVVVGDAAKVRPQLDKLGMPIEVVTPK
ncbi:MAG: insulinase family protein [Alphaproteobacteria bacterium]|nr:insulinase family protein [Alphaproteobacteria bacterium]MBV9372566.1 insulinase family protein [Alphaproteobacteria bacterium]MBV9900897.1 insulinase family protein [Alphaproteobacteria bacterium]